MTDYPPAQVLHRKGDWTTAADKVLLDYEGRFLRRRRLVCASGRGVLVDLEETVSVDHGDAFRATDGTVIEIAAAMEPVLVVTGDLSRLAWHIGNRHTPCQIEPDRLLIRRDHVLEGMLLGLGGKVRQTMERFTPEGGAYGHGRTMGHAH